MSICYGSGKMYISCRFNSIVQNDRHTVWSMGPNPRRPRKGMGLDLVCSGVSCSYET